MPCAGVACDIEFAQSRCGGLRATLERTGRGERRVRGGTGMPCAGVACDIEFAQGCCGEVDKS